MIRHGYSDRLMNYTDNSQQGATLFYPGCRSGAGSGLQYNSLPFAHQALPDLQVLRVLRAVTGFTCAVRVHRFFGAVHPGGGAGRARSAWRAGIALDRFR